MGGGPRSGDEDDLADVGAPVEEGVGLGGLDEGEGGVDHGGDLARLDEVCR